MHCGRNRAVLYSTEWVHDPGDELLVVYTSTEEDRCPVPAPPFLAVLVQPGALLCDPVMIELAQRDLPLLRCRAFWETLQDGLFCSVEASVTL